LWDLSPPPPHRKNEKGEGVGNFPFFLQVTTGISTGSMGNTNREIQEQINKVSPYGNFFFSRYTLAKYKLYSICMAGIFPSIHGNTD
jgi:hypothetical protein